MCELEIMENSRWPDTERRRDSGFAPRPPNSVVFSQVCGCGRWMGLDGCVVVVFITGFALTRGIIC